MNYTSLMFVETPSYPLKSFAFREDTLCRWLCSEILFMKVGMYK